MIAPHYRLAIHGLVAPLSVFSFSGEEALSAPYRFVVEFTSDIPAMATAMVLGKRAQLTLHSGGLLGAILRPLAGEDLVPDRTFQGVVTRFDELGASSDQTHYRVVLQARVAELERRVTTRIFRRMSVPAIIDTVLRDGGLMAHDIRFDLRAAYATRDYTTQYAESGLHFIQRLAADEGLWFRFEQAATGEVIVFGDDLDAYVRAQRCAPFRSQAGLASNGVEAISRLGRQRSRVPASVTLDDYNHRLSGYSLVGEANVARDDTTTDGDEYRWGSHHIDADAGQRLATLRHQAHLAGQLLFDGEGCVSAFSAGEVFHLTEGNPPDAPHGLMITAVQHHAARAVSYHNRFTAIPAHCIYRTLADPSRRPRISGILPATISTPGEHAEAYLGAEGWYRVRMPFDHATDNPADSSRPVRLARPYAGRDYGHHFPLHDGAEVALAFTDGDPDRPVIIGALHDSRHPDLVTSRNVTRNRVRTAGGNELRMEDMPDKQHVHLHSPQQVSEVNLGHLVDAQGTPRGVGAELRTDGHAAVRGAKGVLISADGQIGGQGGVVDMQSAQARLQHALDYMEQLAATASAAQAVVAQVDAQKAWLADVLKDLQRAAMLLSAPDGIALASGKHTQLSADEHLLATAGGCIDMGAMRQFTVTAGKAVSLLAQDEGMKLYAAKGSWQASAHDDEMKLNALKDLTITSTAGRVVIAAKDEIWLGAGGSYLKIVPEGVEIGTAGDVVCNCDRLDKLRPATDTTVATTFPPIAPTDRLGLTAAASPASLNAVPVGMPYQLLANGVMIQEGVTAGDGRFHVERHVTTDYYQLKLANGVVHSIPLSIANEEGEEASRANSGYQAHKVADSGESACGDPHETRYADLLHPETGTDP